MTQNRNPPDTPAGRQFSSAPREEDDVNLVPDIDTHDGPVGSKKHLIRDPLSLSAAEMRLILDDLDERLKARGVAASLYVVGGAALAINGDTDGLTPDVDGVSSHTAVFEESERMSVEYGLKRHWLNANAKPWIPPLPNWAHAKPTQPGLTVHTAPDEHLLAMKIVAARPKDRPHLKALIRRLNMQNQPASAYVDLLYRVYPGEDQLANVLGVSGADPDATLTEAEALGRDVVAMARSTAITPGKADVDP